MLELSCVNRSWWKRVAESCWLRHVHAAASPACGQHPRSARLFPAAHHRSGCCPQCPLHAWLRGEAGSLSVSQPNNLLILSENSPQSFITYLVSQRNTHMHAGRQAGRPAHMHAHTHTFTCAHTHAHICMRTHTHTHMHAHTHTHARTHLSLIHISEPTRRS